jgi:3-dehydroquinate synthetase
LTTTTATAATVPLDRVADLGPGARIPFHVRAAGEGNWAELTGLAGDLAADRFMLVADAGIPAGMTARLQGALAATGAPVTTFRISGGEEIKTGETVIGLLNKMICAQHDRGGPAGHGEPGATRQTVIAAAGGGMVANIAGLAAHLLYRKTRFIRISTTLTDMNDASLSRKQAVNSSYGKNHIGGYHVPEFIWCDLAFLESLPPSAIQAAMCEYAKNVLAVTPREMPWALQILRQDAAYTAGQYAAVISACVDAKTSLISGDPDENEAAVVFEYGHTTAHAIESITRGQITHGHAVGLGLLAAARVAHSMRLLPYEDYAAHRKLLEANGSPLTIPRSLRTSEILYAMGMDNKRGKIRAPDGTVPMVLLRRLGEPCYTGRFPLIPADTGLIAHAIDAELR